jgi:hypothetical protein
LENIQRFFNGVGTIAKNGENKITLDVRSVKQISDEIIPHFDNYPLKTQTQKRGDFELFKRAVNLINNKEHLSATRALREKKVFMKL